MRASAGLAGSLIARRAASQVDLISPTIAYVMALDAPLEIDRAQLATSGGADVDRLVARNAAELSALFRTLQTAMTELQLQVSRAASVAVVDR